MYLSTCFFFSVAVHFHFLYFTCVLTAKNFLQDSISALNAVKEDTAWMRETEMENRAGERYYILLMRGDPITAWEGVKCIHPLVGICPALPPMALACVPGFDGVWHTGHVPSSLLPPGSRDYSTQARPLPSDMIGNTRQHVITSLICPCLGATSVYKNLPETGWSYSTEKALKLNENWSSHSDV